MLTMQQLWLQSFRYGMDAGLYKSELHVAGLDVHQEAQLCLADTSRGVLFYALSLKLPIAIMTESLAACLICVLSVHEHLPRLLNLEWPGIIEHALPGPANGAFLTRSV